MGRKSNEQKRKEAIRKSMIKSDLKIYYRLLLRFHKEKEQKLIEHLEKQESKNNYIKNLILEDMKKHESD